jgi:hypothetical protein
VSQISRETTEQILAATDIVDVIGSYLEVKRAGALYNALCPFHDEKTPSFSINPTRQFFHCFSCKKSGDAISFVREIENITFTDALKKLAARVGIAVVEDAASPKEEPEQQKDEAMPIAPSVSYLCGLALHSAVAQEWLAGHYEAVHEAAGFLEGVPLLEKILSARPDPASRISVNAFMASLSEPLRLALTSDPTFHGDPPENAIHAAKEALIDVCAKALHRRDAALRARLRQPGVELGETNRLLNEIKLVAELRKGLLQRFAKS